MPRLVLADGTVEALKWFALLLMTGDHVNKYLFNGTIDWLFDAGRLCLPIFVFSAPARAVRLPSRRRSGAGSWCSCHAGLDPASCALAGPRPRVEPRVTGSARSTL
ncbi:MAG: hypothetical protein KDF56_02300 [Ottowia sp.]|nr:hypothetical protein [Ottowia sp.]